jgi:heat shock protein HslJ
MKKIILVVVIIVVVLLSALGAYFFASQFSKSPSQNYVEPAIGVPDQSGLSLKNSTFLIPPAGSSSVQLGFIAATSIRDYPMGRFTTTDGLPATLMAYEDLATPFENNRRVVPISINTNNTGEVFYLAVLEGEEMRHTKSMYIGEQVRIQSITVSGAQATVNYLIHDRDQTFAERPRVSTTAIFDIAAGTVVQAGRTPKTEAVMVVKDFKGKYSWIKTVPKDGDEIVPVAPDRFGLLFNANQIEIQTDCNLGNATFTALAGSSTEFTVGEIAATKMFCESAQETIYFDMFRQVDRYEESEDGDLTLYFRDDDGYMEFVPAAKVLEFEATSTASSS